MRRKIIAARAVRPGALTDGTGQSMFAAHPELLRLFNQGNQATGSKAALWLHLWSPTQYS